MCLLFTEWGGKTKSQGNRSKYSFRNSLLYSKSWLKHINTFRRSVTGEGSFNFIGRNAFQLYHSMARIMAPHNQFHSNPTSRPIPIPIHGKRGEFFSVRRECAPLRREEHEQARMGWVSAGSPGSLPFLESPPPPPLPNRIHGSRSVEVQCSYITKLKLKFYVSVSAQEKRCEFLSLTSIALASSKLKKLAHNLIGKLLLSYSA